jgi:RNA recognition motif-containing protein
MDDDAAAKKAIEELNGTEIDGRPIVVNEARERTEDSRRSGGSSSYGQKRDGGFKRY